MITKMKIIHENINIRLLSYCGILTLMFFGINFSIEYATDTYATFGETGTWQWMLYENGRVINALIYYLFELLHLPEGYIYKLSYLTALLFAALSCYLLSRVLLFFLSREWAAALLAFLTIINLYVIEYFLFIEKGLFFIAIFFSVAAFICTLSYFKEGKIFVLFPALLFLLGAVFMYQIMPALYVVLCLPFILCYSKSTRDFLRYNLVTAVLYAAPMACSFFVTTILLNSQRTSGKLQSLLGNLHDLLDNLALLLFERHFHLPGYLFASLILISSLFYLITVFYDKDNNRLKKLLFYPYLVAGVIFASFFVHLTGVSDAFIPRVIYPFGTLPGLLIILTILFKPASLTYPSSFYKGLWLILLSLGLIQYFNFQSVFIDRYRCNQADYYYCQILSYQIEKYERESGNIVDTVCFYKDQNTLWWERGYDETNLNPRAQSAGWSNLNAINHYMEKNYRKGESLPVYEEYFKQYDWGTYTEDQIIFEKNILHLCIY